VLNTPAHFSLTAHIFLKEASIYEVSEKINSPVDGSLSKQQEESFSYQQSAACQCELSALQRGFSNSTALSPADNGAKSELDDDGLGEMKKKI